MKKNETKKSTKEYKNMLSPSFKRNKMTFSQDLFKDLETNKMPLTQKRSQNKLFLNKQKVVPHRNHQRYKSNLENYPENITNAENIIGTNPSISQMSFYAKNKPKEKGKEKEKYVDYKTYIKNSVSRNIKSNSNNTNQLIKFDNDNILSFTCSLKDFRNFVINSCSSKNNFNLPKNNHNYYNNEIKSKKNKSLFSTDYISNIEDTNNTTSINNNISNSKLIYSKQIISEKGKQKKYIKINRKHSRKLYSSMDNNLKINYNNANYSKNNEETKEKEKDKIIPKYNLHHFIYNHNNIKTKTNSNKTNINTNSNCSSKINKYNYNTNKIQNDLSAVKKSLRNSGKLFPKIKNDKKLSIFNPVPESYYDVPCTYYRSENESNKDMPTTMVSPKKSKIFNKSSSPSTTTSQNKCKIKNVFTFSKNKLGRQKSQENYCYLKQNGSGPIALNTINEFNSVEEIHFMFVQLNQSKKQFFEKYEQIKK